MLIATLITAILTMLTILIHYEAISILHRWHGRTLGGPRVKVVGGVFLLFTAHAIEIWLFAIGLVIAKSLFGLGGIEGKFDGSLRDLLYFSTVTYTTLGYGEIWPTGYLRTICGFESLIGLLMMAWSAAYTVSRLEGIWKGNP